MSRLGQELANLFGRELDRLAGEVVAYRTDAELWSTTGAQKNAPGTLALHVVGNLSAFIGGVLGGSGHVRDRDREFGERDVSRDEIARRIRECRDLVTPVLGDLGDETLAGGFPADLPASMKDATTREFLLHLLWHTGWHLGQVYYHRLALEQLSPA